MTRGSATRVESKTLVGDIFISKARKKHERIVLILFAYPGRDHDEVAVWYQMNCTPHLFKGSLRNVKA